jgi:hypothetical protein
MQIPSRVAEFAKNQCEPLGQITAWFGDLSLIFLLENFSWVLRQIYYSPIGGETGEGGRAADWSSILRLSDFVDLVVIFGGCDVGVWS